MADVAIETDIGTQVQIAAHTQVVWLDVDTCYYFYRELSGNGLEYRKSTDKGASWGAPVSLFTATGIVLSYGVWCDKWTPGDTGTKIHIVAVRDESDGVLYRNLDTSDDSLSTIVIIAVPVLATASLPWSCSITKAIGGNLYIAWHGDSAGEFGLERSVDGGTNWVTRTSSFYEDYVSGENDWCYMVPADWMADDQDIAAIFWDQSAAELSLKEYDDSADTVTETSISGGILAPTWDFDDNFDVGLRESDKHIILVAQEDDNAAHDLKVWDIYGSGSIVAKTDVFSATAGRFCAGVLLDPKDDKIYVAYARPGTWADDLEGVYLTSSDGGGSWSAATVFTADALKALRSCSVPFDIPGGGQWAPIFIDVDPAPDAAYINPANAVEITAPVPTGMAGLGPGAMDALIGV